MYISSNTTFFYLGGNSQWLTEKQFVNIWLNISCGTVTKFSYIYTYFHCYFVSLRL